MAQHKRFSYRDYETKLKNLEIVEEHLRGFVPYFRNCRHVVDIGCGSGIFLSLLRDAGIGATGIDKDPELVEPLRRQGFKVILGDAVSIWSDIETEFDGVFCSHLIEHLPFEQVIDLIEGFGSMMQVDGIAVLAFPNPESIEMQLFHFWVDPQHVRFYHPRLIEGVLKHYGLSICDVFTQGLWGTVDNSYQRGNAAKDRIKKFPLVRQIGNAVKRVLGISAIEVEIDYLRRLRKNGREAVIIARKTN